MDSTAVKNAVIQQVRTEASVANAQKLMNVCLAFSYRCAWIRNLAFCRPAA